MAEVDFLITNGTIVDGTDEPAFQGDVAIKDGTIVAVGDRYGNGRLEGIAAAETVDATGCIVTPGWVDAHTHMDGQVTWDPWLTPSSETGVTTAIMGNCGVGFAPCAASRRDFLMNLVEAIEDIPGTAIMEGLVWEWETFEEYLDALDRRSFACDVAAMVGHGPLRAWVLGENANVADTHEGHKEHSIPPEMIADMATTVRNSIAAGAIGFSTSRAIYHRDMAGVLMPGTLASSTEMRALLMAISEGGGGVFGANLDFSTYDDVPGGKFDPALQKDHWESEWGWIEDVARMTANRPDLPGAGKVSMTFEVTGVPGYKARMDRVERINELHNTHIRTQCHVRPQGFLQSITSRMNLLLLSKTMRGLETRSSRPDDVARLLAQLRVPDVRATIIDEMEQALAEIKAGEPNVFTGLVSTLFPPSMIFRWDAGNEPAPEQSLKHAAKSTGRTYMEVYYDWLVPAGGDEPGVLWKPLQAYQDGDFENLRDLHEHPLTVPGVSDAGAHSSIFQDGCTPSHLLTHWARDRTRGPKLPLELVVKKQSHEIAQLFGLLDRGQIKPGLRADINVIDWDNLTLHKPFIAHDLPTEAARWMQDVTGYRMTMLNGVITYRDGMKTGALPGKLVRNPRRDASKWENTSHDCAWKGEALPGAGDNYRDALQKAQGGGASAIGRIARELEKEAEEAAAQKSKL